MIVDVFQVTCRLEPTGFPKAENAHAPVILTFEVQAENFEEAVKNGQQRDRNHEPKNHKDSE